jgi:glycerophosphoryl diester phosphodiesterase
LEAPASTLFAMERALANGAHALELDVHCTKDGVLVVCHDDVVDTTSNGSGAIRDLTFRELSELDNAYWFEQGGQHPFRGLAPEDRRFGFARVEDVLSAFPEAILNFDIKEAPKSEGYEGRLADLIRNAGARDRVIVASFWDSAMARFKELAPDIYTSAPPGAVAALVRAHHAGQEPPELGHVALQIPRRFADRDLVTRAFVDYLHDRGLAVHVWTVNDEQEADELLDMGVDGIMTDVPTAIAKLVKSKGLYYRRSR